MIAGLKKRLTYKVLFLRKNSDFDEIYFSMLDNYNYYSKNRIQDFLKYKLSDFDNYIFTYLKKRRCESGII